jgi:signal transduction histidine kinase/CheY-like chemotaxis protein
METVYRMRTTREDKYLDLSFVPISANTVMAVGEDITERKKAEEVLLLNEERLNALLALHEKNDLDEEELRKIALEEAVRLTNSREGFLHLLQEDGRVLRSISYVKGTPKACSSDMEKGCHTLQKAEDWADCIRTKEPVVINDYGGPDDGEKFPEGHVPVFRHMTVPVLENGDVVAVVGVGNKNEPYDDSDVWQLRLFTGSVWEIFKQKRLAREKEELEQRLSRERRMESIGAFAGGVAHEFNNVLGIVVGNVELALEDIDERDPLKKYLDEIFQASMRASGVVKQILRFIQMVPSEKYPVNIASVVRDTLKLMRATIPKTVEIRRAFFCEFETVLANINEVGQVLINLCANSVHAMKEKGGTLEVRLESASLDDSEASEYENLKAGEYVKLSVTDDGCGIDPKNLDRIFEPYFTTKEVDEGLGMGLAVVYGIAKNLGGAVKAQNCSDKGTCVEVFFPLADEEIPEEAGKVETPPKGSERILFIDDEPSLVKTAIAMLKRLGYRAEGKTSAWEALEMFRADPGRYDLVVTDMAMPEMGGDRLTVELKKIRPDLPVMLCTGHSDRLDKDAARRLGVSAFVMKPLFKSDLAAIVRGILDNPDVDDGMTGAA